MNTDPTGQFVITALLIGLVVGTVVGAAIGGAVAYHVAQETGATGWELFGWTMLGIFGGALLGGAIGAGIGAIAPAIGSFLGSSFALGSVLTASGELIAISVTGAQIAAAAGVAALAGMGIMFARTGKSNGYWGEKWPGDHSPDHAHIKGDDGTNIRIDIDGNPLDGKLPKPQVRKAIKKLLKEIRKLFGG